MMQDRNYTPGKSQNCGTAVHDNFYYLYGYNITKTRILHNFG